jgi:hypothetical protein
MSGIGMNVVRSRLSGMGYVDPTIDTSYDDSTVASPIYGPMPTDDTVAQNWLIANGYMTDPNAPAAVPSSGMINVASGLPVTAPTAAPAMSYVRYNENLYRTGFRPYGQTDPFAASQLNGIRTPFDPAKLHGAPFTKGGGWALHGLGDTITYPSAAATLEPPWWAIFLPGGPGTYVMYKTGQLVYGTSPGDPALNVSNAITGQLTPDQVNQIKQQAADAITQAAGGDATLAASEIAQTNTDIDSTLGASSTPWWMWAALAAGVFLVAR